MKQANQLSHVYLHESIKNIDRLSESVCEYCQIDPKQHTLYVLQRRQEIVVIVEEPILASQLRYQQKAILHHINRALLGEYKTIKVKLSPPRMAQATKNVVTKQLSKDLCKLLDQTRKELDDE